MSVRFVAFWIVLALAPLAHALDVVTGTDRPWSMEFGHQKGYVNHLVSEAFHTAGYEVSFTFTMWKTAYREAEDGQYDATSFWTDTDRHSDDFHVSDPVMTKKLVFFKRKDTPAVTWNEFSDLGDLTIGAARQYPYTEAFWQAAEDGTLNLSIGPTNEQNMRKLMMGRVDLVIIEEMEGWTTLRGFDPDLPDRFEVVANPVKQTRGHVLFPKKHGERSRELVEAFNAALEKLTESGWVAERTEALKAGGYY